MADEAEALKAEGGVAAVDRALAILAAFEVGHEQLTLAQLARRTGFYKSTILRLAQSLERAGYLHREAGGAMRLGAEPLRLAAVYRRTLDLEARVRPVLQALRSETGETAAYFRREGERRLCLYREETERAIRHHVLEGDMLPLDRGAAGRVLARYADPAAAWDGTATASFGERDAEVAAVAAPVFSAEGLAGALAVSGPLTRLTPERAAQIGPMVAAQARALSRTLGARR